MFENTIILTLFFHLTRLKITESKNKEKVHKYIALLYKLKYSNFQIEIIPYNKYKHVLPVEI
jgi:hypothetical protein